jgi:hypothetical protein
MSLKELKALPEWGASNQTYRRVGDRFELVERPQVALLEEDDYLAVKIDGLMYTFGQYEDGGWYRKRCYP